MLKTTKTIKQLFFFVSIIAIVFGLSYTLFLSKKNLSFQKNETLIYNFPSKNIYAYYSNNVPYTGRFFIGFKEAIAFKESQGLYDKVNSIGHVGKYQFGALTLKSVGVHDANDFLTNELLQEKAFITLLAQNKWYLRHEIKKYSGKIIDNVLITESGILAAAHLGGAKSVKKYLKSGGKRIAKDDYGTSIKKYMRLFSGYDTSMIAANKNGTVKSK